MQAVALTAGHGADFLLLIASGETQPRNICPHVGGDVAKLKSILPIGDRLPDHVVRIERIARLLDVGELHRLANFQHAAIGLFLPDDHAKQRRLAGAVGPDDADDSAGRQRKIHLLHEDAIIVAFGEIDGLNDELPEARAGRNVDFDFGFFFPRILGQK